MSGPWSGKLEVLKQETAWVNVDILGISQLKWTGMGEFNSDDHYIYYCGKESLRRKIDELSENLNKEIENIKNNQLKLKNIKNEKYSWENQQQIRKCKRWISNLEDIVVEITQSEQEEKKYFQFFN